MADAWRVALPVGTKRYGWLFYEVATGPLTAGKFTVTLAEGVMTYKSYPQAAVAKVC